MKSINEVIKAIDICFNNDDHCHECPYVDSGCYAGCNALQDALFYLKEYVERLNQLQDMMDRYDAQIKKITELIYDSEGRNDPLTWEEIKTMVDKPIWIEEYNIYYDKNFVLRKRKTPNSKRWDVIKSIDPGDYIRFYISGRRVAKQYLGLGWKAYRKERQ